MTECHPWNFLLHPHLIVKREAWPPCQVLAVAWPSGNMRTIRVSGLVQCALLTLTWTALSLHFSFTALIIQAYTLIKSYNCPNWTPSLGCFKLPLSSFILTVPMLFSWILFCSFIGPPLSSCPLLSSIPWVHTLHCAPYHPIPLCPFLLSSAPYNRLCVFRPSKPIFTCCWHFWWTVTITDLAIPKVQADSGGDVCVLDPEVVVGNLTNTKCILHVDDDTTWAKASPAMANCSSMHPHICTCTLRPLIFSQAFLLSLLLVTTNTPITEPPFSSANQDQSEQKGNNDKATTNKKTDAGSSFLLTNQDRFPIHLLRR